MEVETGTSAGTVQIAADGQDTVADPLGLDAPRREAPQQSAARIHREGLWARQAGLPPGGRGQDAPLQVLQAPTVLDQVAGQPIQQLRMRRLGAVLAEIVGRVDQPHSELMLPHAIDNHPGGQRVVRSGDPVCQSETPVPLRGVGGQHKGLEQGQCSRGHGFPFQERIATMQPMGWPRLRERSGIHGRRLRQLAFLLAGRFEFRQPTPSLGGLGIGDAIEAVLRSGRLRGLAGEWRAILGGVHRLPDSGYGRQFDAVLGRQSILEVPLAVTPPDHTVDANGLGELQLHPTLACLAGNPRPSVAGTPIIQVLQLVDLIAGQTPRGRGFGSCRGQSQIDIARPSLELIDARFATAGGQDGEAKESRFGFRKAVFVPDRIHGRAKDFAGRRRRRHRLRNEHVEAFFQIANAVFDLRQARGLFR